MCLGNIASVPWLFQQQHHRELNKCGEIACLVEKLFPTCLAAEWFVTGLGHPAPLPQIVQGQRPHALTALLQQRANLRVCAGLHPPCPCPLMAFPAVDASSANGPQGTCSGLVGMLLCLWTAASSVQL